MPDTHEPSEHVTPPVETPPVQAYAPPHPYAAGAAKPSARPAGLALSIAAMASGLIALLTSGVGFFFAHSFGVLVGTIATVISVLLALAAIVLGIVALVRRQRNKAAAITGIAAGALAGFTSIVLTFFLIMIALSPGWSGGFDTNSHDEESHSDDSSEVAPMLPQTATPLDFTGAWPSGFADGGVTFDASLEPIASAPLQPGDVPLVPATQRGDGPADIQLFVDYRCPICAVFEATNAETLESVVSSGEATLQVRSLTFLDRVSAGSEYSSRAAAAMACVVSEQPKSAWKAHATLLSGDVQPSENNAGLDDAGIIAALEQGAGPLSATTQSCITERAYVPFAQAFTDWSFANAVPNAEDPNLTVMGTPFAVVNGVPYEGPVDDQAAFSSFLEAQGIVLK